MPKTPESPITVSISSSDRKGSHPVQRAADLAFTILVDTYPVVAQFEDRLISTVTFADRGAKLQRRVENKPRRRIWLYRHLNEAGLSGDELDKIFYSQAQGDDFYTDVDKGEILLPKSTLDGITRGAEPLQKVMANSLAEYLVYENIRLLAQKSEPRPQEDPYTFMWRFMMLEHMAKPFFAERGAKLKGKKQETFYEHEGGVRSLLGSGSVFRDEVRYFAVGGKVVCVMKDNPVNIFEFALGGEFDYGVISALQRPVHEKILKANPVTDNSFAHILRPGPNALEERAVQILEVMGLSSGQDRLSAYMDHLLPELYLNCSDYRLNPFNYASLMPNEV